jgi:hypothetical protein
MVVVVVVVCMKWGPGCCSGSAPVRCQCQLFLHSNADSHMDVLCCGSSLAISPPSFLPSFLHSFLPSFRRGLERKCPRESRSNNRIRRHSNTNRNHTARPFACVCVCVVCGCVGIQVVIVKDYTYSIHNVVGKSC